MFRNDTMVDGGFFSFVIRLYCMYVALLKVGAFVQKKIVFLPGESTVATPGGKAERRRR